MTIGWLTRPRVKAGKEGEGKKKEKEGKKKEIGKTEIMEEGRGTSRKKEKKRKKA